MKIDFKTILLLVVIIVLAFFLFDTCIQKNKAENETHDYLNYKDTVLEYKAKNGQLIQYNNSLKLTRETMLSLNDSLKIALKNIKIKKPTSYTKIVTKYVIDTVELRFTDTLPCDDFIRNFLIDSTNYFLSGYLTKELLSIDRIEIPNTQNIIVGTKKNGLFKANQYVITVQNSNPYMNIVGLQNYTLNHKKRWFEKTWFQFGAGVLVGGFTYYQITK